MSTWRALMDTVYYDSSEAWEHASSIVNLEDNRITVSYDIGDLNYRYIGDEIALGHFNLTLEQGDGRASLHMFPGSKIMEGYWVEDGARGFWRLILQEVIN